MNIDSMREMLVAQMELLKAGDGDPARINAMVNAAGKIISSVRLEMEYARMIGAKPLIPFIGNRSGGAPAPALP